jgi:hypothetical protein
LSSIFSIVVKLTIEFTSLEEPANDSDVAIVAVFHIDGSNFNGSERQIEPKESMWKFRLPIVSSISWSKLAKTGVRVGGWGWKSTVPKDIWFPSTFELLLARSKKSDRIHDSNAQGPHGQRQLTRVNSENVLDDGHSIRGRGRRMNSKVKISQTRRGWVCVENKHGTQLAQSQSFPGRPLLAPLYRWPGLEEPVGFNTNYNVFIWCHLVFWLHLCLGLPNGAQGYQDNGPY